MTLPKIILALFAALLAVYPADAQAERIRDLGQFEGLRANQLTGYGVVVNTSFNVRGEPIVCTPNDALRAFATAKLDHLALGNHLVSHPGAREDKP